MLFGVILFGVLTDIIIKKKIAQNGKTVPEDRLPIWLTIPNGIIIVASLFMYGWSCEANTHWIVPMIGVAFFCFGLMGIMVSDLAFLIRAYTNPSLDVSSDLPRRLIHPIRRLCGSSRHCSSIHPRRFAAACRVVNVQRAGTRLGK